MAADKKDFRSALNALRGFASIYVVFYHIRYFSDFNWFDNFPPLRFGYIGVDFFFILSGLIISHVYLHRSLDGSFAFWRNFFWLRVARLFPVHLMIMVLLMIAALIGPFIDNNWEPISQQSVYDWFSLTFLVRQWTLPDGYAWNTPAWSVSAEFFAYLIIFPIISILAKTSAAKILGFALALSGSFLFIWMIMTAGTVNVTSAAGPLVRVSAGFALGTGIYLVLNNMTLSIDWNRCLNWTLISTVPIFGLATYFAHSREFIDIAIIAYLIALISATYCADGRASALLSQRHLFMLGELSFSLYLCHVPVMQALAYMAATAQVERGLLFGLASIVASILTAHVLFRWVEIPARDAIRKRFEAKVISNYETSLTAV